VKCTAPLIAGVGEEEVALRIESQPCGLVELGGCGWGPSPEKPAIPVPATTWILPCESTLKMRWFCVSPT